MKKQYQNRKGFTMAELLIALMVTSIILSAVATLAYSLGSANKVTSQMGLNQAFLRNVTLRVSDLVRRSNQVLSADSNTVVLWADGNADGVVDASERITIQNNLEGNAIIINQNEQYTLCQNVQFFTDVVPPDTKRISVFFDLQQDGDTENCQITASLRCSDKHYVSGG
jgi:prepilin-type N-terminal cleavage/methylation domain-containing protein